MKDQSTDDFGSRIERISDLFFDFRSEFSKQIRNPLDPNSEIALVTDVQAVIERGTVVNRSALLGASPLSQRIRFMLEMPIANLFDFLL